MTETRVDSLITYFNGSLEMIKLVNEKEPGSFGKNSEIASNIFKDILSILNYVKTLKDELPKIEQTAEGFDGVLDELKKSVKIEE